MFKKDGFILIEVLVYILVSIVLVSVSFNMMFSLAGIYRNSLEKSRIITCENDCCLNINRLLKRSIKEDIDVKENSITIKFINEEIKDEEIDVIEKIDDKLIIKYYPKYGRGGRNVLIKGITDFIALKKGRVIYITIIKGGILYKWCI